jgi:hypothetical protein
VAPKGSIFSAKNHADRFTDAAVHEAAPEKSVAPERANLPIRSRIRGGHRSESGEFLLFGIIFACSRHAGELVAVMKRFIAVQEPTCTWAVIDTIDDVPAEFGDVVLIGLEMAEATKLAALANAEQTLRAGQGCVVGAGLRLVVAKAVDPTYGRRSAISMFAKAR